MVGSRWPASLLDLRGHLTALALPPPLANLKPPASLECLTCRRDGTFPRGTLPRLPPQRLSLIHI